MYEGRSGVRCGVVRGGKCVTEKGKRETKQEGEWTRFVCQWSKAGWEGCTYVHLTWQKYLLSKCRCNSESYKSVESEYHTTMVACVHVYVCICVCVCVCLCVCLCVCVCRSGDKGISAYSILREDPLDDSIHSLQLVCFIVALSNPPLLVLLKLLQHLAQGRL